MLKTYGQTKHQDHLKLNYTKAFVSVGKEDMICLNLSPLQVLLSKIPYCLLFLPQEGQSPPLWCIQHFGGHFNQ